MGGGGGGDTSGGGGITNLLMLNPRFRQMMQAQQQQKEFQQQQAAKRLVGQALMGMAGNNGQGTPQGPAGFYTGTPGQNTPPPGWQPPGMQGPQGGPQQPPGLPPPPGQASQRRIGLNGQPVGPNPTVGDASDTMSQGPAPPRPPMQAGGTQTGSIGATFNPMAGTPGRGNGMSWDQFKPIMQRRESAGGKNVPNYMFDRGHTASGVNQITASTWNRYAPALGIEKASYDRPAMSFSQEEQDAVGKAIFEKEGAAPWANYDKPLRNDLTKAGINPGIPEGRMAADQAQSGQLDWRAATRAVLAGQPGAKPEDVAEAVNMMLPFMNQDSQNQWKSINAQLAAGRLFNTERHQGVTEGQGAQRVQQGEEKLDIQRQALADRRQKSEKRLAQLDEQLVLANKKFQQAKTSDEQRLALQHRRELETLRHNAQQELTSSINAQLAAARLINTERHQGVTEGQGQQKINQGEEKLDIDRQKLADQRDKSQKRLKQLDEQLVLANKKLNEATDYHSRLIATQNRRAIEQERHNAELEVTQATNALANLGRSGMDINTPETPPTKGGAFGGGSPGFTPAPEVGIAKENVARARSALERPPAKPGAKPAGKTPAETITAKKLSPANLTGAKKAIADNPEAREQIIKDLQEQGYDTSGL